MSIPKPGSAEPFPPALQIPEEVLAIARQLEAAGFETWCVGGAVRDNLLQEDNKDFDLATAATPADVQRIFAHTVPLGIEHGTVAVLDRHRRPHEVTTFRRDVRTDGRHAVVEFGVSLEEDLSRRDFTINAIAHHPLRNEWRDPFDGRADLARGVVRAVGEPERRFREDYLRILRAVRFSTRFGFQIEPGTWAAACAAADGLQYLSAERVREEWFGSLISARQPGDVVKRWQEVGALTRWLPEVDAARAAELDRFMARDVVLMTALLSADPGVTLARLRCSKAEIERGRLVAGYRDRWPDPSREADVRRWMATVAAGVEDLLVIAAVGHPDRASALRDAVNRVRSSGAPLSLGDLAVTGRDLQEMGIGAGPRLGKVLRYLLEQVLEDPSQNTKGTLLALAKAAPGNATVTALFYAVVAALGNIVGGLAVARGAKAGLKFIEGMLAFGAGFMLSVAIMDVLPEAWSRGGTEAAAYGLAGYLLVHLTQHTATQHFHFGEETHTVSEMAGASALAGLLLHTFFDGVAIASGFGVSHELGILLFLAVFLHKLPEGVTISSLQVAGGKRPAQAVGSAALLGGATVLGVLVTDWVGFLSAHGLALSGGVTLYVGASNLVPEFQGKQGWRLQFAFFSGAGAFLLARWLLRMAGGA